MASKHHTFSLDGAISYGWQQAKKHWGFLVVCLLITFGVNLGFGLLRLVLESQKTGIATTIILQIVSYIIQMGLSLGLIGVALKLHDRKKTTYSDLFGYFNLVLHYFVASIIFGLILTVGFVFIAIGAVLIFLNIISKNSPYLGLVLIIPGILWIIYFSIRYKYFPYLMVDKKLGIFNSLGVSSQITKGNIINLLLLGIVLALINIIGALLLLVGLLFTVPLTIMAEVYVYRKLATGR